MYPLICWCLRTCVTHSYYYKAHTITGSVGCHHHDNHDKQDHQANNYPDTQTFLAALVVLLCLLQFGLGALDVVVALEDVLFDAVDFLPLGEYQS